MVSQRRLVVATVLALGAAGFAVTALLPASTAAAPDAAAAPIPVQAERVAALSGSSGAATPASAFAATIRYDREAQLAFRVPGRIAAFPVHVGDRLPRGALVAMIEATPFRAAAARADADRDRTARAAQRYTALASEGAGAEAQARDSADLARAAAASADAAGYDLRSARLVMPFGGLVIAKRGEVGEFAGTGQSLVTVADAGSPLLATAQVPAALAARLQRGQSASVTSGDGSAITGNIRRLGGAADPRSGLVPVDIALSAGGGGRRLASGTPVSVSFAAGLAGQSGAQGTDEGTIPAEALLEAQGNTASVYVIDARGVARRRQVRFFGFTDRDARIGGVAAGTMVITKGAGFVHDGQRVEVVR
jgi:RND family efflux transporter MFP subunit